MHERVHLLGQHLLERLPGHLDAEEAVPFLELLDRDPVPLRKAGRSLLGHVHGRALDPAIRSPGRHVVDEDREPSRRDQDLRRRDAQSLLCGRRQLRQSLAASPRRQFLAADLNQERRHRLLRRAGRNGAQACERGRCTRRAP